MLPVLSIPSAYAALGMPLAECQARGAVTKVSHVLSTRFNVALRGFVPLHELKPERIYCNTNVKD